MRGGIFLRALNKHMPTLTEKAIQIALVAHATQVRKIDHSPYVVHPIMVGMKLARYGFSDEVVAAALVHDVLEDTTFGRDALVAELGEKVAKLVDAVSEDKTLSWENRKRLYIETVRAANNDVKAISVSDKIHNGASLIVGYERVGGDMWKNFTRPREQQLWFFREMLVMLQSSWQHPLVDEFAETVSRLERLV